MNTETQLATQSAEPSVALMLQTMVEKGIGESSVAAFEKLCELKWKMEERDGVRAFNAAFVALQSNMKGVEPTRAVPGNNGETRYRFAPFEEIMRTVQPILQENGFAVTFDSRRDEGRVVAICTLLHTDGHSINKEFAVRIGSGPPKSSEAQGDGSAMTYAKRFALCNALNIVVEHDDDARAVGAKIDAGKAAEIQLRVRSLKKDEAKFLKWAGASTFDEIGEARVAEIDAMLTKLEAKDPMKEDAKW